MERDFFDTFFPSGVGQLRCPVQHYAWGRPAATALVARLAGIAPTSEPCAELWMGAHSRAPSHLVPRVGVSVESVPLTVAIERYPDLILGRSVAAAWGRSLPFLFKVLSIGGPLSIQAHPDSTAAARLHARDPHHYPDPNHKPEIALALTPVELLAGCRSPAELESVWRSYPEIAQLVSAEGLAAARGVTQLFRALYTAPATHYVAAMNALGERLCSISDELRTKQERYFLELLSVYGPSDRGLVSLFVLQSLVLSPGEAVAIGPNLPHAYLSGELIECMANSDNVVRAGLTTKFQDHATLLELLNDTATAPPVLRPETHKVAPGRLRYAPAREFFVERCVGRELTFEFDAVRSAQILLCLEGRGAITTTQGAVPIESGFVAILPAMAGGWTLSLEEGTCFVAGTPV